ncbi:MAG: TonB-dependent receptor [Bacteroidales bacterium]|nr:TonB-dependent receptor [Bacteroidales bacterium]
MRFCVGLLSFLAFVKFCYSQTYKITGKVYDNNTREPLIGATVFMLGSSIGTSTDTDGSFILDNLKKGTYTLVVTFLGYKSDTLKNFSVVSPSHYVEIYLTENNRTLKQVDIISERIQHSENSILQDMKRSETVSNGVSSELISKNQDKNTAEAIKRIPGITIQNEQFVVIRGLADRYNITYLNHSMAPSFENDKKSFAFDMLPTSMIERIMVYKTGNAEFPAEFSGGMVQVVTKKYVDSNFTQISISQKINELTTFHDFKTDKLYFSEYFGFTNRRNYSEKFPAVIHSQNGLIAAQMLPNTWKISSVMALPDPSLNITTGHKFKLYQKNLSNLFSLGYSSNHKTQYNSIINYNMYIPEVGHCDTIYRFNDQSYQFKSHIYAIHSMTLFLSNQHLVELKQLFSQGNSNTIIEREGINFEEGVLVKNYSFNYQERRLYHAQLHGEVGQDEKQKISWTTFFNSSFSNQPDYKRVRTVKDLYESELPIPYQVIIPPSASTLDAGRFFANLREYNLGGNIQFQKTFKNEKEQSLFGLKAGLGYDQKKRSFQARWISYKQYNTSTFDYNLLTLPIDELFEHENFNTRGLTLVEGTNPSDRYHAENQLFFGYVSSQWTVVKKIKVISGLRLEHNTISLYSRNYSNQPVEVFNPILTWHPYLNSIYQFDEKNLLRLAYFKSINRPEFRELAPFAYYDFSFNNVLIGNENLNHAIIHNIDFRWEYYSYPDMMMNVGVFYKYFLNPIEMYYVPGSGSGGTRNFTFKNAQNARNYGMETELRKSFSFTNIVFNKIDIIFNTAYIFSQVNLGETNGQKNTRMLMGQSPYILNLAMYLENTMKKWQLALLYNVVGKRIAMVGTYGTPDIYEMPRNMVDISLSKKINKVKLVCGINNLINAKIKLIQDSNEDNKINHKDDTVFEAATGRNFHFSFLFSF